MFHNHTTNKPTIIGFIKKYYQIDAYAVSDYDRDRTEPGTVIVGV